MSQVLTKGDSQEASERLLEVSNLKVYFTNKSGLTGKKGRISKAIDGISFSVRKGEILSVVGESGSGKTTLARCVMKLTTPTSGEIKYEGAEIGTVNGKKLLEYRKNVQVIYQDPYESLNPRQDVFATIAMPIRYLLGENNNERIRGKVSDLLQEVGLNPSEVMHKYPHQLSGGERQRVNIARALAPGPKLLIADEPITMLDAAQRLNTLRLLIGLKSKYGLTIVMITHDLASAKLFTDRTLVMYLGKIVEMGPTLEVLSRPYHPYVEIIREATPKLVPSNQVKDVSDVDLGTTIEESSSVVQGCVFRPRCKYATDICKTVEPPLKLRTQLRYVSCHNPVN